MIYPFPSISFHPTISIISSHSSHPHSSVVYFLGYKAAIFQLGSGKFFNLCMKNTQVGYLFILFAVNNTDISEHHWICCLVDNVLFYGCKAIKLYQLFNHFSGAVRQVSFFSWFYFLFFIFFFFGFLVLHKTKMDRGIIINKIRTNVTELHSTVVLFKRLFSSVLIRCTC